MKKILITGGCGYIGSALNRAFLDEYDIDSVDLELYGNPKIVNSKKDFSSTDIFTSKYDVIIHLASVSSVSLCKNRYKMLDVNVYNFLKFIDRMKPNQKVIYASSSCVYDNLKDAKETDFIFRPSDDLAMGKAIIDSYMQMDSKVEYYGLRFGSVNGYSPNLRTDLMINAMTLAAQDYKPISLFNAKASRPILGMKDLISAIRCIIESTEDNRGIYNVHSFNAKIGDVAKTIAKLYDSPIAGEEGKSNTFDFTLSSQKFIETFNWKPEETIESIVKSLTKVPVLQGGRNESK